jgi:hypothetical protein
MPRTRPNQLALVAAAHCGHTTEGRGVKVWVRISHGTPATRRTQRSLLQCARPPSQPRPSQPQDQYYIRHTRPHAAMHQVHNTRPSSCRQLAAVRLACGRAASNIAPHVHPPRRAWRVARTHHVSESMQIAAGPAPNVAARVARAACARGTAHASSCPPPHTHTHTHHDHDSPPNTTTTTTTTTSKHGNTFYQTQLSPPPWLTGDVWSRPRRPHTLSCVE